MDFYFIQEWEVGKLENLPLSVILADVEVRSGSGLAFFNIREDMKHIELYYQIQESNLLGRRAYDAWRSDPESTVKVKNYTKDEILLQSGVIESIDYQITVNDRHGLVEVLRVTLKNILGT